MQNQKKKEINISTMETHKAPKSVIFKLKLAK